MNSGILSNQRVAVFVDVQNMYYSARALFNKKVNFQKILENAVGDRQLVRAFAYGITTEEAHEEDFHEALAKQGFEIKSKPLQTFAGGQKKGDWDVGIATDIMRLEPKIDVAVLVSGDGDFIPLLQFAKEKGLRMEVMSFRNSTSSALVEAADLFTDLSEKPRTYLIGSGRLGGKTISRLRPPKTDSPRTAKRPTSRPSTNGNGKPRRRKPRILL